MERWKEDEILMERPRAILKWNSGHLAFLCNCCGIIVKVGFQFNEEEMKFVRREISHLDPIYCEECKPKSTEDDVF